MCPTELGSPRQVHDALKYVRIKARIKVRIKARIKVRIKARIKARIKVSYGCKYKLACTTIKSYTRIMKTTKK